jgi:hypothetical protein
MKSTVLFLFALTLSLFCFSEESNQSTAVVSDSKAAAPEIFLSYNYYHYDMTGQSAANTGIYKFGKSTVDLQLITATWLYSSDWTLLAFVPHIKNRVETIYEPTQNGLNFSTTDYTMGLGDVRLMAVTPLSVEPAHLTMLDVSLSLPTGSINEYFSSNTQQRAAYNMQLGSGTPDIILGTTLTNTMDKLISTARGQATIRSGRNSNGYALGDEFQAKITSMYSFNSIISTGVAGNYKIRGAVIGKDEKYELFNAYQSPVDPQIAGDGHQYYHGTQANWDASLIAKLQTPSVSSVNAAFELGVPVAQGAANKDDVRLDLNYYVAGTLNASF